MNERERIQEAANTNTLVSIQLNMHGAHKAHLILFLSVLHFVEINTSAAASGSEFTVSQIDKTNNMSGGTISVRIGEFLKEKKFTRAHFVIANGIITLYFSAVETVENMASSLVARRAALSHIFLKCGVVWGHLYEMHETGWKWDWWL